MKYRNLIFIILVLGLFLTINSDLIVHANNFQPPTIIKPELLPGPDSTEIAAQQGARAVVLNSFLPKLTVRIIGLIGAAALLGIVISGIRYATSYANEENLESAKNQLIYSIIGFIVAILSYTIVSVIGNLQFDGESTTPAQGPPAAQNP